MFRMVQRRVKKIVAWLMAGFVVLTMGLGVWWLATAV